MYTMQSRELNNQNVLVSSCQNLLLGGEFVSFLFQRNMDVKNFHSTVCLDGQLITNFTCRLCPYNLLSLGSIACSQVNIAIMNKFISLMVEQNKIHNIVKIR
jgi:hypothetical protein